MKHIYLYLIFTIISFCGFGQSGRLKYADKLFAKESYFQAASAYEDVLARKVDSSRVASRITISYDKLGDYSKSVEWYRYQYKQHFIDKEGLLRLALLERRFEQYSASTSLLREYQEKYGPCDVCENILNSKVSLSDLKKSESVFVLKPQPINTTSSEIVGGYLSSKELLISSSKRNAFAVNRIHGWTGGYFYDVYKSSISENGELGKLKRLKGKVRSKYNEGPVVYHPESGYLYFTRNTFYKGKKGADSTKLVHLSIYRAKYDGKRFGNVESLNINSNSYSTAHPALSKDGKRLYFSSDRPGGFGGMDLYAVDLEANGAVKLATIKNLGSKVNTSAHELFPFYQPEEDLLLFSSEGHFGFGGLDVYLAQLNSNGEVRKLSNVGSPINGPSDDFSFVNNATQTFGYFSSNRSISKGSDDVFGFVQSKPFENESVLSGDVRHALTNVDLEDTKIYLQNAQGTVLEEMLTNDHGMFEFSLGKGLDTVYLVTERAGFLPKQELLTLDADRKEYERHLLLMPILDYSLSGAIVEKETLAPLEGVKVSIIDRKKENMVLQVLKTDNDGNYLSNHLPYTYKDTVNLGVKLEKEGYVTRFVSKQEILGMQGLIDMGGNMTRIVVGKTDLNELISINPIYFDFNSSVIRSDAKVELDKIVEVMRENPNMVVELGSHTDSRGDAKYNLWLSDRRAKSSAQYIISQGIPKDRIYGKGYGKTKLLATDAEISRATSEEEKDALHQKNRRTEFIIVKLK